MLVYIVKMRIIQVYSLLFRVRCVGIRTVDKSCASCSPFGPHEMSLYSYTKTLHPYTSPTTHTAHTHRAYATPTRCTPHATHTVRHTHSRQRDGQTESNNTMKTESQASFSRAIVNNTSVSRFAPREICQLKSRSRKEYLNCPRNRRVGAFSRTTGFWSPLRASKKVVREKEPAWRSPVAVAHRPRVQTPWCRRSVKINKVFFSRRSTRYLLMPCSPCGHPRAPFCFSVETLNKAHRSRVHPFF